jgi:hypothetical protein
MVDIRGISMPRIGICLLLAGLVACGAVRAQSPSPPAPPAASETEQFVWRQAQDGRPADLNQRCGTTLDPHRPEVNEAWSDPCRVLSGGFLVALLTAPAGPGAPTRIVHVTGAMVQGPVDLEAAMIRLPVRLEAGRFAGAVTLTEARLARSLALNGSRFAAPVRLDNVRIEGSLLMHGVFVAAPDAATVPETARTDDPARFGLTFRAVRIDGDLALDGSVLEGGLLADGIAVGGYLFLRDMPMVAGPALSILNSEVRRNVELSRTEGRAGDRFAAPVRFDGVSIVGMLLARDAQFELAPSFVAIDVGRLLDLTGISAPGADLSATTIKGELRLSWQGRDAITLPRWGDSGRLVLRETRAGALQETPEAWPRTIDLQGFAYDRLGGFRDAFDEGNAAAAEPQRRGAPAFIAWLARDPLLTPQPYRQLAGVLRAAGERETADAVMVAYRDRELAQAWAERRWGRALWLEVLRWTIGYGIGDGKFRVLYWVAGFTLLGALVLSVPRFYGPPPKSVLWRVGASLDQLLPIVSLSREFDDYFNDPRRERLRDWQVAYFAGHALVGYLLASFLVAALAGLTQGG